MRCFSFVLISTIALLTAPNRLSGQLDFFHDVAVNKNFSSKDSIKIYSVISGWKHIYNEIGWKRLTLMGQAKAQFSAWNFGGGLGMIYTFDKDIQSNMELRPYAMIGLKTKISSTLIFSQLLRSEFRTFFFSNSENNYASTRLRYNLNLPIILYENRTKGFKWKIRPEMEFYFQQVNSSKERFNSSTEYALTVLREGKKMEIGIGYKLERFNRNFNSEDPNGQTITAEFNF